MHHFAPHGSLIDGYKEYCEIIDINNLELLKECNWYYAEFYKLRHPQFIVTNEIIDKGFNCNHLNTVKLYINHTSFIMTDKRMENALKNDNFLITYLFSKENKHLKHLNLILCPLYKKYKKKLIVKIPYTKEVSIKKRRMVG